jgi:predicted PurR-regulated permease PerM
MVTGLLIIYALIIMIAPELYKSVVTIWNALPENVDRLIIWLSVTFAEHEELIELLDTGYETLYTALNGWIQNTLVPYATNIVSGVGQGVWKTLIFLKNILIGLIVAVYLLGSRKRFAKQGVMLVRSMLRPRWADLVLNEIAFVDRMFGGFIDGKLVDSAIIGVLCYIGCVIFRFPNALLISAIVGITNVIPFIGPFIGAIPSILLILIEDPIKAIWFALFILALQQLDGNIIGPTILGDRTGLSNFWVLFSIVFFGGIWGLVGMVICVPLFAVIYDIVRKLVYKGLRKHSRLDIWDEYKQKYPDEEPKTKPKEAETEKTE